MAGLVSDLAPGPSYQFTWRGTVPTNNRQSERTLSAQSAPVLFLMASVRTERFLVKHNPRPATQPAEDFRHVRPVLAKKMGHASLNGTLRTCPAFSFQGAPLKKQQKRTTTKNIVQELCESRGGRPGLSVLMSLLVSVDVKPYRTMLRHWSQLVPNMSTDF